MKVLGFLYVALLSAYASTAAAQELSLFGVQLRDDKSNYATSDHTPDPAAVGYVEAYVMVPLKNN